MPLSQFLQIKQHQTTWLGTEASTSDPATVVRHPSSGISVLVVGAGIGGLMAALECWRKGHDVHVLEKSLYASETGDFLTIGPSAVRVFQYWPDMAKENEEISYDPWISYHKHTGARIRGPEPLPWDNSNGVDAAKVPSRIYRHHRPKFHRMLLAQARRIGIEVVYNERVVEYYENATAGKGGVVLESEADLVIAADGLGTKSYKLVVGQEVEAKSSGYAIYRAAYPVEHALADPLVAERFKMLEDGRSVFEMWFGPDLHSSVWRSKDIMTWNLTHKDNGSAAESWGNAVEAENVIEVTAKIDGWPEIMDRVIRTTPKKRIVDWKLMWRDPQTKWISPQGRVLQLGDSAHTFLPSSGNGGTQAIEDAISLATYLQVAGKSSVPWAVKMHNELSRHRTDWKAAAKDTKKVRASYGKWIWQHNAEDYAYENYGKTLRHLLINAPFRNTNISPEHTYKA